MHITILTVGSRGDVQPYLALGCGLRSAGHDVRIVTHRIFAPWAEAYGLAVHPMDGNPAEAIQAEAGRSWLEAGGNPLTFVRRMLDAVAPLMWEIVAEFEAACVDTELIIYPVLASLVATSLQEKYGTPICPAYLQPVHPSRYYPIPLATPRPQWGGLYNRLAHGVSEAAFWQMARPIVNQWRISHLGLPGYPLASPFMHLLDAQPLCLYGLSPHVMPPAPDWPAQVDVTGYWFLDAPAAWQPPPALTDFLAAGPPPVYIGFGSMNSRDPAAVAEIAVAALKRSGQRGLLVTGWGGLAVRTLPDEVFVIEGAPHDWLLPRMAAVVHHGGCGTTAAGLRAGVPAIVVPFFADQPFWAARVHELGVGPPPLSRAQLSGDNLAVAIRTALQDGGMRWRAADLGRRIRAEDGIARAMEAIEQTFS